MSWMFTPAFGKKDITIFRVSDLVLVKAFKVGSYAAKTLRKLQLKRVSLRVEDSAS